MDFLPPPGSSDAFQHGANFEVLLQFLSSAAGNGADAHRTGFSILKSCRIFPKVFEPGKHGSTPISSFEDPEPVVILPCDRVRLMFVAVVLTTEICAQNPQDQNRNDILITDSLATMCGYTISQDDWGNMTFRGSIYSCYVIIQNDTYFTVPVKMQISSKPDFSAAESYVRNISCPYTWRPREIVCQTNYMEVSVRRKIPVISEGVFKNEPEDWASAFDPAVAAVMSIWQVVFHKSATQKTTMSVSAAQNMGYGIATTESRTLLRSPYNASEAVPQRVGGVTFSTLRATLFYKQRWFIYLVDNAVACPVDDVVFSTDWITWTIPKDIRPLIIGAKTIQRSSYQFGLDLLNLTANQIVARKYEIKDDVGATVVRVPMGAEGGYYKSHVVNREHGITYHIRPFLETLWTDDSYGITKYTIIKDIKTPFERRPPIITNDTIPSTFKFTVTIGTFLPDVQLVNITIGGTVMTIPEAHNRNCTITPGRLPNGTNIFVLKVPFANQLVTTKVVPDGILLTLTVTYGFNIIPFNETFTATSTTEYMYPKPDVLPCRTKGSSLTTTISNLDPSWSVYVKDTLATSANGLLANVTRTSSTIQVSPQSDLVQSEMEVNYMQRDVGTEHLYASMIQTCYNKDSDSSHKNKYGFDVKTAFLRGKFKGELYMEQPPGFKDKCILVCLSDGSIQVTVYKAANIPLIQLSQLTLRDKNCKPSRVDTNSADFSFFANSCQTSRKFENDLIIYENEVTFYSPESGKVLYIMNVTCKYTTNGTVSTPYGYEDNIPPSEQSATASLNLILRLSKDISYTNFYGDPDYPVVKYLREPLYFEVELLYSSDAQVELFLENCWATTSPDMTSFPSWPIIVDSCEYGEPYQTVFHPVTADSRVLYPSHFKRFEVKTFSFMIDDKPYTGAMYFHCDVIICDAADLSSDSTCTRIGSCIPAKQRLGRSLDDRQNLQSISSKAVVLLAERAESYIMHYNPPQ
ncbi:uncharacterized protein PAF06_007429 [Gastrophryne carolinensis]